MIPVVWQCLALKEYFHNEHGDWLAVDFSAAAEREKLSKQFGVSGIPSLIVVDSNGKAPA